VGDVISVVGLGFFGSGYWAPTARGKYFSKVFSGN